MKPRPGASQWRQIVLTAVLYFVAVFGTGFVLGAIRVTLVVPRIGERYAELAEMPLMLVAVFVAAGHVVRRFSNAFPAGALPVVGGLALALLLVAELLLAVVSAPGTVREYLLSRDPVSGSVYIGMLVLFAAMPWLRRRQGDEAVL
jgi:hypothetical protein